MFVPIAMKRGNGYQIWSLANTMRQVSSSSAASSAPAAAAAASPPPPPPPPGPPPPNPNIPPTHMEVFINDQPVVVPKGVSVLQACDAAGVDIPRYDCARNWRMGMSRCHRWACMQVLLPSPTFNRWKLPHVPR